MLQGRILLLLCTVAIYSSEASRARRQCFTCRSRGELGDCRDPFPFNETSGNIHAGVRIDPCPSGWCKKLIEGVKGPPDDFGTATERGCLTQPPPDGEERCVELRINNKATLLCLCRGDLCNKSSERLILKLPTIVLSGLILRYLNIRFLY